MATSDAVLLMTTMNQIHAEMEAACHGNLLKQIIGTVCHTCTSPLNYSDLLYCYKSNTTLRKYKTHAYKKLKCHAGITISIAIAPPDTVLT
jgi:hypothetical protein